MLIYGLIPVNSFKAQVRTIKELQREFGKKVKISVQDNTIWYETKQK